MQFRVPRHSDEFILDAMVNIARQNYKKLPWHISVQFIGEGSASETFEIPIQGDWKSVLGNCPLTFISCEGKLAAAQQLSISSQDHSGEIFRITRDITKPTDTAIALIQSNNNDLGKRKARANIGQEIACQLKGTIGNTKVSAVLGDELGKFVEARDASLARLEELYARFTGNLAKYREETDQALTNGQKANIEKLTAERANLQKEFDAKEAAFKAQQDALNQRLKEIDDRDSRHARRELREKILTELKERSQKFELTKGTQKLRWPVTAILAIGGIVFLAGASHTALASTEILQSKDPTTFALVYLAIKQITFTAAFISILWYGVKWSDRWFREHAEEEFRAKSLQLDIERASWVVETTMEWKQERDGGMPPELLEKLSQNLFASQSSKTGTEQGAITLSELLGSASKMKTKLGEHVEMEFDRKGTQKLGKAAQE